MHRAGQGRQLSKAGGSMEPAYPLLRMFLFAISNLAIGYSTLTWIPSQLAWLVKDQPSDPSEASKNTPSIQILPSLSLTLMSLFVCQTILGLVQHSIPSHHAIKSKAPTLFVTSFNTAMAIGAIGTLICHVFAVLFGAGVFHQAKETLQLACYLSLLSFYPAAFVLGTDVKSWLRIFIRNSPETFAEAALYCQGMMAIFGAWLGSIVIPLDWDRPWQAWPVPCVLGAFLFYMIGTVVGLVTSIVMRQRAIRKEFGIGIDPPSAAKIKKA